MFELRFFNDLRIAKEKEKTHTQNCPFRIRFFEVCVQSKSKFNYFYVIFAPIKQTIINDDDDYEWTYSTTDAIESGWASCTTPNEYLLCFYPVFIHFSPPNSSISTFAYAQHFHSKDLQFVVCHRAQRVPHWSLISGKHTIVLSVKSIITPLTLRY